MTLEFWDNQQAESGLSEYQQAAVDLFEETHPNIKVNVVTIPYPEYQDRLVIAVRGGTPPDVSTVDQIWNYGFATGGAIVPLDDYDRRVRNGQRRELLPRRVGFCRV